MAALSSTIRSALRATSPAGAPATLTRVPAIEVKTSPLEDICLPGESLPESVLPEAGFTLLKSPGEAGTLSAMRSSMRKEMKMVLGSSYQLQTNSTGFISTQVSVNQVAVLPEFASFASLFDEFFVSKMVLVYQPYSQYQKTQTGTIYIDFALALSQLHHGASLASSHANSVPNASFAAANTSTPFKYTWNNVEKRKTGQLQSADPSAAVPSQGWCLTSAAPSALYTGSVQIISPSSVTGPVTFVLGTVAVRWEVIFRSRA